MSVHVQLSRDQDVSRFCFLGSQRMKPCDTNDWNEDRDHLEQLLREGEELRHLGGVHSGAAVPPHQELKRFRRLARLGRAPRAESGRAGWITSPICICKNLSMLPWELVVGCGERTVCNFTTETDALLTQTRLEHEILLDRKKMSLCNLKFRFFQPGTAVYSHVCVFGAVDGVYPGVYPPLWAANLNTTFDPDKRPRQEGSGVSVWH